MTFKRQDTESTLGYVTSISKSLDQFQNIRRPGSLPAACLESRQIMTPYFCFECDFEHLQDTVTGPAFVTLPKNPKVERGFVIAQRSAQQAHCAYHSYQCVFRERCAPAVQHKAIECRRVKLCTFRGKRAN
ncbi:hypothetical protein N7455_006208 [Penicillium solitum]|uniref:uncharacterized protein n=1 Tax=Penicillium solitum TaxID=60172 RepID=UPI0032C47972|nr:hypothetical protein N7455_006208 [Penicillium solitum]